MAEDPGSAYGCPMLNANTHITRFAALVSLVTALGAAGAAQPSVSRAADTATTSRYIFGSPCCPWVCYSWLAGYKAFQYSNCTGLSTWVIRRY